MSELLQAHHCITLEQWNWGALALQQAFWGNLLLGIAFIFLWRFELDLPFSSNGHSSDAHKRIMPQFFYTRKLVSCINTRVGSITSFQFNYNYNYNYAFKFLNYITIILCYKCQITIIITITFTLVIDYKFC